MNRKNDGFTFIEVMIVVMIIAVLTTIAIGSFGDSTVIARRTDGRAALVDTAGTLEKCKAIYGSYNNVNCSISNGETIASPEDYYQIAVTSAATTFSLTASPTAGKSQTNDTDCTTITLNHLGQQSGTGAAAATSCW